MQSEQELVDRAKAWIAADPDPVTQAELSALIDAKDWVELGERMNGALSFGTAGLRGIVGAGPNRMNRAVVIRTTSGLASYLLQHVKDARTLPVIVGYDGRLTSEEYARDTIRVLTRAGIPVRYFAMAAPTPLVAYAARQLGASAAVVVTASHNPAEYNGYKVYAGNAIQIVPPVDEQIADAIEKAPQPKNIPLSEFELNRPTESASLIPDSLIERYYDDILPVRPACAKDQNISIVYTPMHGVGWRFAEQAFLRSGYRNVTVVAEQAAPDGHFPTVKFPNPEEAGAMDLAFALAAKVKADVVVANDPDADRLAIALPKGGGYQQLTGNQVGLLLADFALQYAPKLPQPLVAQSIVSSPMLESIATAYGAAYAQTLTGFKWIWNAALDLARDHGVRFCFGYEEALGYSIGPLVRDKDGISVAVVFADLVAHCKASGTTVLERLAELYRRHGLWVSFQRSLVMPGTSGQAQIAAMMKKVTNTPPPVLGTRAVVSTTDYQSGEENRPRWLHNTSLFELRLAGGGRVLVRPSGTEPKLKIYVDLRVEVAPDAALTAREAEAEAEAKSIAEATEVFLRG